jgi:DNA-binding IclR family transcriptional regulator
MYDEPSVVAIGISAPVNRLSEARCKKVVLEVKAAAAEIGRKLGYANGIHTPGP